MVAARVNQFLAEAVALVRGRFGGKVTYAAIQLERVDWSGFDIVSLDLYRSAEVADRFAEGVRALVAQGKPVAITEFGAATFAGAGDRGARALEIVEHDKDTGAPLRLDGEYLRDEDGRTILHEIRGSPELADVPVFVISGASDLGWLNSKSGMDRIEGFLEKPIELTRLLDTVASAVTPRVEPAG